MAEMTVIAIADVPEKRKRGRPPKNTTTTITTTEVVKRKRGRPPKNPVQAEVTEQVVNVRKPRKPKNIPTSFVSVCEVLSGSNHITHYLYKTGKGYRAICGKKNLFDQASWNKNYTGAAEDLVCEVCVDCRDGAMEFRRLKQENSTQPTTQQPVRRRRRKMSGPNIKDIKNKKKR